MIPAMTPQSIPITMTSQQIIIPAKPTIFQIHKTSKTDPFCRGVNVCIGATVNKLCIVTTLIAYLAIRGSKSGLLFNLNGLTLTKYTDW